MVGVTTLVVTTTKAISNQRGVVGTLVTYEKPQKTAFKDVAMLGGPALKPALKG